MDEDFRLRTELYVLRSQKGDSDAMNLLVDLWTPRLKSLVAQWASGLIIDEVVQQVWLDILSQITKLNDPANFPAWIRRIAYRCCATAIHRKRSTTRLSPNMATCVLAPSWLPIFVGLLGSTHRRVFTMHYIEGYSVEEIAAELGLSPGTVKSRLHTSRRLLRNQFSQNQEF